MIPKSYVESLAVSPEIVEKDLAATQHLRYFFQVCI
jgi:hypothetical protein